MLAFIKDNKLSTAFFSIVLIGFLYLQFFGYSLWNTLPNEVEKPSAYGAGSTSHHK